MYPGGEAKRPVATVVHGASTWDMREGIQEGKKTSEPINIEENGVYLGSGGKGMNAEVPPPLRMGEKDGMIKKEVTLSSMGWGRQRNKWGKPYPAKEC